MDDLLTPVKTTYLKPRRDDGLLLSEAEPSEGAQTATPVPHVTSPDEALNVLKSQPDYDSLVAVLRYLTAPAASPTAFQLHAPSPKSAAIVHELVSEVIPNFWTLLQEANRDGPEPCSAAPSDADLALQCLRSVAGLNAVVATIRALIHESRLGAKKPNKPDLKLDLGLFLNLLDGLLNGDDAIRTMWSASDASLPDATQKRLQSHQLVTMIASGRILSAAAEAADVLGRAETPISVRWIADGVEFSRWIGRNISSWARRQADESGLTFCAELLQRSMSLGYSDTLAKTAIDELLLSKQGRPDAFSRICLCQNQVSKKVIRLLLEHLSHRFLNSLGALDNSKPNEAVSAAAGIIDAALGDHSQSRACLVDWCTASSGGGLGDGVGIRRAVVAVLAKDREAITTTFEKSLAQFGDQLYIKHAAILQQEVHTQILLLSAGYVARLSPIKLAMILRSGTYLSAISNRIAATQAKARFLGMSVGESLSALADNKAKKLDFHMEEMETDEADWLKGLARASDPIGPHDSLLAPPKPLAQGKPAASTVTRGPSRTKARPKPAMTVQLPKAVIEEVNSSGEDEDLVPYAKGSDPEDSDDDATLVQRNKPKPPVYIRDLIAYLRDSENYDRQKLALQTAPVLIRRKANYGAEVSSHADELGGLLVGLQDKFDIEDFAEKRQQGMIALVVSQPERMAPWFARTFFEGDYSLAQRTSVLVALGLSARELAGYDASEYQAAASFPSKRLPGRVEQLYLDPSRAPEQPPSSRLKALPRNALDGIADSLAASFLGPLAAQAADARSGPDALKLQTFKARYKSARPGEARPRVRAIPNTTAALLAASFFSPLTAHFRLALRSSRPVVLNPALLSLYLQTLGIVVGAAGPSTLSLPQLTSELWDLLLRVRVHVLGDVDATKGWLVAMAVLLDVNGGDMRRICAEQGRELVETREWVSVVFENTRGGDGGEENDVKMLAAAVLIKLGEAIDEYQALLLGDLVGFS